MQTIVNTVIGIVRVQNAWSSSVYHYVKAANTTSDVYGVREDPNEPLEVYLGMIAFLARMQADVSTFQNLATAAALPAFEAQRMRQPSFLAGRAA